MKKVERRIGRPALYTFDCFLDEKCRMERGWPENISKLGWYSIVEVKDVILLNWKHAERNRSPDCASKVTSPLPVFEPRNYVDLNRNIGDKGDTVMTWFIHYNEGMLCVDRPALACPFDDPDLYIPTRWGDRVIGAACQFIKMVEVAKGGSKIAAVMFDNTRTDCTYIIGR